MANSFRKPLAKHSINRLCNPFVHARVLTLKMQIFTQRGVFASWHIPVIHKSFSLFSSHILVQHTINLHINAKLLVFLSLEICLTGTIHGLDAWWPFVPSVIES